MGEYFAKLIKQFVSANNLKNVDIQSEEFQNEFLEWVINGKIVGLSYKSFLKKAGALSENDTDYIEIGKGIYDSIVLGTNTPIITPYTKEMEKSPNKFVQGEFMVYDGIPIAFRQTEEKCDLGIVNNYVSRRIITQNPYEQKNINNWDALHNNGYNITVGVFGHTIDKDIDFKIEQLKSLKESLCGSFSELYATDDDRYFYAISSDIKKRKFTIFYKKTK